VRSRANGSKPMTVAFTIYNPKRQFDKVKKVFGGEKQCTVKVPYASPPVYVTSFAVDGKDGERVAVLLNKLVLIVLTVLNWTSIPLYSYFFKIIYI
jgi:hypothetical protein